MITIAKNKSEIFQTNLLNFSLDQYTIGLYQTKRESVNYESYRSKGSSCRRKRRFQSI
ncbi:protein of unknown function [Lactiplantibacillus plantarum]